MHSKTRTSQSPFAKLGLSPLLCQALQKRMGFRLPTPIQRKAIPAILQGSDVISMARTGSGKTIAFMAPLIELLQAHSPTVGVRAIILSPTRELALQTDLVARKLVKLTNLKLARLVGGSSMDDQFDQLSQNPDIILATPGRLVHHLVEVSEFNLKSIKIIVVDEADRLFELGFASQLKRIWDNLNFTRQSVFVSATLPAELIQFSKTGLKDPVFVRLDAEQTVSDQLEIQFLYIRETEKPAALLKVAQHSTKMNEKSIVFVSTRHHVEFLGSLMIKRNFKISMVYGKMDHEGREKNLFDFRKGKTNFLIVTDVAARGLDIPEVNRVINYDFPSSNKLFIHRSGRTARAGSSGIATSFVTQNDLPYTFELALFLNRKISLPHQNNKTEKETCYIGGLLDLSMEIEFFDKLLKDDSEMISLQKSMIAAYKLYYKTRNPASNSSVTRSKTWLESLDGSWKLLEKPHPSFIEDSYNFKDEEDLTKILGELRSFRPSQTKKGGKIASSITNSLKDKIWSNTGNFKLNETNLQPQETSYITPDDPTQRPGKRKLNLSNQFYLDTSLSEKKQSQVTTFALEQSNLDLTPDEDGEMRRNKTISKMKWNPNRKKYEMTTIDHHGRVLKDSQGNKIKGELKNKGLYKRWASQNRTRIQRTGEIEDISPKSKKLKRNSSENDEEENNNEGTAVSSQQFNEKKKLLLEAKKKGNLTHKQSRQLKKYSLLFNDSVKPNNSKIRDEIKRPEQLAKLREKRKLKSQNTKKGRMLSKEKWQKKHNEKIANYGRNNRSILIRRTQKKRR